MTQLDPVTLQLLRRHDVIDRDTLQKINSEGGVGITVSERVALLGGICTALIVLGMFTHAVITGDMPALPLTSLLQTCTTSVAIPMTPMTEDKTVAIRPAMIKMARRDPNC